MSLVAAFTAPLDAFALGSTLDLDGVERVEFDCNIPAGSDGIPYFWVWGDRSHDFERIAGDEPAVRSITLVDELDEVSLYRAEWRLRVSDLLATIRERDGVLRKASGRAEWEFEIRFSRRADLTAFTDRCSDVGAPLELERLYALERSFDARHELTPTQRETLVAAETKGYFEEPRKITMEDLAEELGVSLAAASGRMRRATSNLVRSTLL